ncbi:MAG TPA: hypothetical protein PKJ70_02745 [Chitinophagaceae bacterium]|nr:hypothetical protein [Chitinophagaceae bacterium]HNN30790.1 hypothetical protein [Chitinophagaceae bacterium]
MLTKTYFLKYVLLAILVICKFNVAIGQAKFPVKIQNKLYAQLYEKWARENNIYSIAALQPYCNTDIRFNKELLSFYQLPSDSLRKKRNFFTQTFRNGNMAEFVSDKSTVTINPLFQFEFGKSKDYSVYHFNRGIQLDANFNNKVFISSSIYENVSKFPKYINQYIDSLTVVPGMGKARYNTNGKNIEYALPIGFIGYKPNKNFYFELGNNKNFIGNGYRSLLLSDVAYSYPYFKMQTHISKFTFQTIWSQFVDASKNWVNTNGYDKKFGAFNTVSYTGIKNVELNLFQSVIWSNKDSLGNRRDQEWGYFVPIIFFNSLNFNNGSPDNSLIGVDASYTIKKHTVIYGQLIIDDFNIRESKNGKGFFQNKYGVQLGVKSFKPFNLDNAFARIEFNTVRPYTYASKTPTLSYTHYGEVLAHPFGANFREFLLEANYKIKRYLFSANLIIAWYGADDANSHWGKNIYKSDYLSQTGIFSFNNKITQGIKTNLIYSNVAIRYLMNPVTNSGIAAQIFYRTEKSNLINNKDFIFNISYSTNLLNILKEF